MLLLGRVSSIFHHIWVTEEKDFDCHSSQAHCYTKRPPLKFSKLIGIVVEWDKYLLWKACCVLRIIFRTKSKSLFAQLATRHQVAPCLYRNMLLWHSLLYICVCLLLNVERRPTQSFLLLLGLRQKTNYRL